MRTDSKHALAVALIATGLAFATSCAASRAYERVAVTTTIPAPTMQETVVEALAARGYEIVANDAQIGRVEALELVADEPSFGARYRWRFWVRPAELEVELVYEARFAADERAWESSPYVCAGYEYLREREALAEIEVRLAARLSRTSGPALARAR